MTEFGIKEMLDKSATVGGTVYIAGLGRNTQSVPTEQQAAYFAAQCWGRDIIGRIVIAVEVLQETQMPHSVLVFTPGCTLPRPGGDEVILRKLKYCANMRLEETSVAQLFSTSCMVDLATSECFSNKKKSHFLNYSNPHVNYDNAPHLRADDILLTLRAWIFGCAAQSADDWR
jgi:hypothetical protein